jgi:hypothetical protein
VASSASGFEALSDSGEFKVHFFSGKNSSQLEYVQEKGEAFIWQWNGTVDVEILASDGTVSTRVTLEKDETFLIQQNNRYRMVRSDNSEGFVIRMVRL